jgi:hypothetical protein
MGGSAGDLPGNIRRLYPATSAAIIAASLRSTRPVAKAVLPQPHAAELIVGFQPAF